VTEITPKERHWPKRLTLA